MPRPIVEVLDDFGWTTGPSTFLRGVTDVPHKRLNATFDATEEAENERMTRLVFGNIFSTFPDPAKLANRLQVHPGILVSVMEGVAQRRATHIFRLRDGKDVGRTPEIFYDDFLKVVKNKEVKAKDRLMQAVCVSVATNNAAWLKDPDIKPYVRNIVDQAIGYSYTRTDKRSISLVAKRIASLFPSDEELAELDETKRESFDPNEEEGEESSEEGEDGDAEIDTKNEKPQELKKVDTNDLWGKLSVVVPPLAETKKLKAAFKANKHLKDSGKRIVRLNRALVDGKIFRGSKRKTQAGTILFDNSGSMGLSPEMIEDLIIGSPGSKVAIYSGDRVEGTLTVVAANGKVASTRQFTSQGNNLVDGPALVWLGRQEGPRVWVSDGQVTGVLWRAGSSLMLHKDVARIRKKYNIKWLNTMQFGRSGALVPAVIAALAKGTFKDGGDTVKARGAY